MSVKFSDRFETPHLCFTNSACRVRASSMSKIMLLIRTFSYWGQDSVGNQQRSETGNIHFFS